MEKSKFPPDVILPIFYKIQNRIRVNKARWQEYTPTQGSPFSSFLANELEGLVPLDGVINLEILKNDCLNKTILLIGEQHQTSLIYDLHATPTEKKYALGVYSNERRARIKKQLPPHADDDKFNCTPIIKFLRQLFNKNIARGFNIDFFIETEDRLFERQEEERRIRTQDKLQSLERGKLTRINLQSVQLNQIRQWVRACMIYRGPEFSAMATMPGNYQEILAAYDNRICYKNVKYHWFDIGEEQGKSGVLCDHRCTSYLYYIIRLMSFLNKYRISVDDIDKQRDTTGVYIFPNNPFTDELKYVLILTTNTTIIKESQKSGVSMQFLIDHFWFRYHQVTQDNPNWKQNVFDVVRIVIDMYLFCRLMKDETEWYKNIIIYGGNYHILDLRAMLEDYNPIARGNKFINELYLDSSTLTQLKDLAKDILNKKQIIYFTNKNLKDTKSWSDRVRLIAILNVSEKVSMSARLLEEKVEQIKQTLVILKKELLDTENILFQKLVKLCTDRGLDIYTRWAKTDYKETTDSFAREKGWLLTNKHGNPNKNIKIGIQNGIITALNYTPGTNPFFYLLHSFKTDDYCVTKRPPRSSKPRVD